MHGLILAHAGVPLAPHDLWTAWNLDPLIIVALVGALWLHRRGRRRDAVWRNRAFAAAMAAIAIAIVSPLDALSGALASAHMVQHVLLVVVAAPLLAFSSPGGALLRGAPVAARRVPGATRRRLRLRASTLRLPSSPAVVWLLHVVALWVWHSAAAYDAALSSPFLHAAEHLAFLGTGVLLWRVAIGRRTARASYGASVLLVFGTAMQSVFLSFLLTFANEAWYGYGETTAAWGLTPLADQQLAGAIMWIPAGIVYVVIAMVLLGAWLRSPDAEAQPSVSPASSPPATSR
ncbi:MAG: cytochrome c oxidase assembly protein [Actinobacteria bacterium]|nr:cytochrome c oxidase assembly protein [Actinomycetota bacterium]